MAGYKYTFFNIDPNLVISPDNYSEEDNSLVESFKVNSSFNQAKNFIETHYYSLDGQVLKSIEDNTNIQAPQDAGTANQGTLDSITLKPETDLTLGGFTYGDVNLYYNFLNDIFGEGKGKVKFFIEEIAGDRFEIRLLTTKLSDEKVLEKTKAFKKKLQESDNIDFRLNLGSNQLLLATNIDTLVYEDSISVVIRLYNQLPEDVGIKQTLYLNELISDPVAFSVKAEIIEDEIKIPYLKGPNFSLDISDESIVPSQYQSINELFNYPLTGSYYELKSYFNEKGAQITIDYSDYSDFIHFGSAEERLLNFKYKLDLINSYQSSIDAIENGTVPSSGLSNSRTYYESLINNLVENFDHYDRYLYFESSSYSWPKSGSAKPYTPLVGSATGSWISSQLSTAADFDVTNPHALLNTVPEFLREDPNNAKYATFLHLIGQHFDNLWVYSKAVTDKYNADNRLSNGVSKDLVQDLLKNFGVKIYTSNKSTQDLFSMFTGQLYQTGSETVNTFISASDSIISEEDYRKEIYKRLYHNLPLIIKSKGTERGLRAVLNSFGVPAFSYYTSGSDSLHNKIKIKQFGGTERTVLDSYFTSSIDRIRIDNTGSIVEGNTLSQYTSIVKRDDKYTHDSSEIEVGFSPTDYIDNIILASASIDLDSILGDPKLAQSSSYDTLISHSNSLIGDVERYNLKDFTRLLKFYDNVIFKSVKDFTPARSTAKTGIIIKPHLLERNKAKQTLASWGNVHEYSGSLPVGDKSGSHAQAYYKAVQDGTPNYLSIQDQANNNPASYTKEYKDISAAYSESVMTAYGPALLDYHTHEEAKFDGELSGSYLHLSVGELNDENIYKYDSSAPVQFKYTFFDGTTDCNVVWGFYEIASTPSPTATVTQTPGASLPAPAPSPSPSPPALSPRATSTPTPTPSTSAIPPQPGITWTLVEGTDILGNLYAACADTIDVNYYISESFGPNVQLYNSQNTSDPVTTVQGYVKVSDPNTNLKYQFNVVNGSLGSQGTCPTGYSLQRVYVSDVEVTNSDLCLADNAITLSAYAYLQSSFSLSDLLNNTLYQSDGVSPFVSLISPNGNSTYVRAVNTVNTQTTLDGTTHTYIEIDDVTGFIGNVGSQLCSGGGGGGNNPLPGESPSDPAQSGGLVASGRPTDQIN